MGLDMDYKFKVVSIHPVSKCDWNCKCCYVKDLPDKKPLEWFLQIPKKIKDLKLAEQCCMGGGECFLFQDFLKAFGRECKKNNIIFNVTTNGKAVAKMADDELKEIVKDMTMVSVSFDRFKIRCKGDVIVFEQAISKLKKAGVLVGINLLVDKFMFGEGMPNGSEKNFSLPNDTQTVSKKAEALEIPPTLFNASGAQENIKVMKRAGFFKFVASLMKRYNPDRIFILYPKGFELGVDILKFRADYYALSALFPKKIFVDDLTGKILMEQKYSGWILPCHYGKVLSIFEDGSIAGCSFEKGVKADLENLPEFEERRQCPFLKICMPEK